MKKTKSMDTSVHHFEAVLKYPFIFLGLGGIFSCGKTNENTKISTKDDVSINLTPKIIVYSKNLYRIITGTVNILCFAKTIAMIIVLGTLDKSTVEETLDVPFCTFVWLSGTYVFSKNFTTLSASFLAYERKFGYTHNICNTRRRAKMVTLIIIALHSCFKLAFGISHTFSMDQSIGYIYPFEFEGEARKLTCLAVTLVYFLIELTPYYLLVHYVLVVHILASEFRGARDEMSLLFITVTDFEERFSFIRARHRCLQDMVDIASLHFRSSVVLAFVFNILVFCFLVYVVSSGAYTTYGLVVQIVTAGVGICGTLCITVTGGALHTAAHSICDSINKGDWGNLPVPVLQKMNLFLTQFATKKIGFDIYGLFMLDTTTLLMGILRMDKTDVAKAVYDKICEEYESTGDNNVHIRRTDSLGTVLTYGFVYLQFTVTPQSTCEAFIKHIANGSFCAQTT